MINTRVLSPARNAVGKLSNTWIWLFREWAANKLAISIGLLKDSDIDFPAAAARRSSSNGVLEAGVPVGVTTGEGVRLVCGLEGELSEET